MQKGQIWGGENAEGDAIDAAKKGSSGEDWRLMWGRERGVEDFGENVRMGEEAWLWRRKLRYFEGVWGSRRQIPRPFFNLCCLSFAFGDSPQTCIGVVKGVIGEPKQN